MLGLLERSGRRPLDRIVRPATDRRDLTETDPRDRRVTARHVLTAIAPHVRRAIDHRGLTVTDPHVRPAIDRHVLTAAEENAAAVEADLRMARAVADHAEVRREAARLAAEARLSHALAETTKRKSFFMKYT